MLRVISNIDYNILYLFKLHTIEITHFFLTFWWTIEYRLFLYFFEYQFPTLVCSIIHNNDRASGEHGTMALSEFAYAAGSGLKLTQSKVQDQKQKPIKSTHSIFHQRREKCVSYVPHKDLVCSWGYLNSLCTTFTCYCIRAVNSLLY